MNVINLKDSEILQMYLKFKTNIKQNNHKLLTDLFSHFGKINTSKAEFSLDGSTNMWTEQTTRTDHNDQRKTLVHVGLCSSNWLLNLIVKRFISLYSNMNQHEKMLRQSFSNYAIAMKANPHQFTHQRNTSQLKFLIYECSKLFLSNTTSGKFISL